MDNKKVVEVEEALEETPVSSDADEQVEAAAVVHRYVKTEGASTPTKLESGKVITWQQKKYPSGMVSRWGTFETSDEEVAKELDAIAGVNHIHKTVEGGNDD
jgi:hypothetical protein